jgi:LmbE family N-acetylglucosaminyl deacetylase
VGVHIFLSPHLDDAVFSCGGLIGRFVNSGEAVTVLTVCAGDPPTLPVSPFARALHERWGVVSGAAPVRRAEDRVACGLLGSSVIHLDIPDAIYRLAGDGSALYPDEAAIMGPLAGGDNPRLERVVGLLGETCPPEALLDCPSSIGGHVDHRLARVAAERLGRPLWYYFDLPYAARDGRPPSDLGFPAGVPTVAPLAEEEIQRWASAAAEYRSQLSTFWPDPEALYQELVGFHDRSGGIPLVAPL